MTSAQALAHMCDQGTLTIVRAHFYHKGVMKKGLHLQFTSDKGSAAAWSVGFQLAVFKLYARCVEKGLVDDVQGV